MSGCTTSAAAHVRINKRCTVVWKDKQPLSASKQVEPLQAILTNLNLPLKTSQTSLHLFASEQIEGDRPVVAGGLPFPKPVKRHFSKLEQYYY